MNVVYLKVVTGGQYDVDVSLANPKGEILYQQVKAQFDSHQFTAPVSSKFLVVLLAVLVNQSLSISNIR